MNLNNRTSTSQGWCFKGKKWTNWSLFFERSKTTILRVYVVSMPNSYLRRISVSLKILEITKWISFSITATDDVIVVRRVWLGVACNKRRLVHVQAYALCGRHVFVVGVKNQLTVSWADRCKYNKQQRYSVNHDAAQASFCSSERPADSARRQDTSNAITWHYLFPTDCRHVTCEFFKATGSRPQ